MMNKQNNLLSTYFHSDSKASINSPELLQNWIELSQSAIEANAQQFQAWLGSSTQIAGVVKSNAYGHGLVPIGMLYESCETINSLCVINLTEAVTLRKNGIKKPILVMGYLELSYDLIIQHSIEVIIYDFAIAQSLNDVGQKHQQQVIVHIKFDTGMSRLGLKASEIDNFIDQIKKLPWITIKGIFSHLGESYNSTVTQAQEAVFAKIMNRGLTTHLSNSHGSLITQTNTYSFARIGIGLYGYLAKQTQEQQALLKPVLSLKTRILQIKSVTAGSFVGYDGMYQAQSDITIAILAIGYAEGLDARLSNIGSVIINDQLAPIIGRICMNLTIVNITRIHNCTVGQVVTILGSEGKTSITAYDWSNSTKASTYNLLTKLSSSLVKIIVA